MKIVLNKIRPIFSIGVAIFYSMVVTLPLAAAQELLPGQSAEKVYTAQEVAQASRQLRIAAKAGDREKVRLALSAGADINGCDSAGRTPLMWASRHGKTKTVGMLLEAKAEVNQADDEGYTPLMYASVNSHPDVVGVLIKAKAEVNQADRYGETSLLRAIYRDRADVIDMLIQAKAEVNQANQAEMTPLMYASQYSCANIASMLLEAKAEVDMAGKAGGWTPLMKASQYGHADTVGVLIKAKAEVNRASKNGSTPLMLANKHGLSSIASMLIEAGADASKLDDIKPEMREVIDAAKAKRDALQQAAEVEREKVAQEKALAIAQASEQLRSAAGAGDMEKVRLALSAGADINGFDAAGRTPLMHASRNGCAATVGMLIQAKAEVNQASKYGLTPLLSASFSGRADVVDMLLRAKAEVDKADKDGLTPLRIAHDNGRADVAGMLIEAGADDSKLGEIKQEMRAVIETAKAKRDALQQQAAEVEREKVAQEKAEEITQTVVDVHSELEQVACIAAQLADERKLEANKALLIAAINGREEDAHEALRNGAHVDATDPIGRTPLMWAIFYGHEPIVPILLAKGANGRASDNYGNTPVLIGCDKNNSKILSMLDEYNQKTYGDMDQKIAAMKKKAIELTLLKKAKEREQRGEAEEDWLFVGLQDLSESMSQ